MTKPIEDRIAECIHERPSWTNEVALLREAEAEIRRLRAELEPRDDWEELAAEACEVLADVAEGEHAHSLALRLLAEDAKPVLERYRGMTGDDAE